MSFQSLYVIIEYHSPLILNTIRGLESLGLLRGNGGWYFLAAALLSSILFHYYKLFWPHPMAPEKSSSFLLPGFYSILVLVILTRLSDVAFGHRGIDEDQWIVAASTLASKPIMWKFVDTNTSGPLTILPLTLLVGLGIKLSYFSVRLLNLFLFLIPSLWFTYKMLVRLIGVRLAWVTWSPLAVLVGLSFVNVSYNGEFPIMFLVSIALYYYAHQEKSSSVDLFLAGLSVGLLAFTKPQAIPIGLVLGLGFIIRLFRQELPRYKLVLYLAGSLLPTVGVALYITYHAIWFDFLHSYIQNNLLQGSDGGAFSQPRSFIQLVRESSDYFFRFSYSEYSFWFITVFGSTVMGLWVLLVRPAFLKKEHTWLLAFSLLLFFTATFCALKTLTFFRHYINLLLIPGTFLLGVLFQIFRDAVRDFDHIPAFRSLVFRFLLPVFLIFNVVATGLLAALCPTILPPPISQTWDTPLVKTIKALTKPGQRMALWGWDLYLYTQTGLLQGTRDAHSHYQIEPIRLQPYYLSRYLSDLKTNKPALFVESFESANARILYGDSARKEYGIENFPEINAYIRSEYDLMLDQGNTVRVFRHKALSSSNPVR